MGSMWLDPPEDGGVYPCPPGNVVPDFDPAQMTKAVQFPADRWGADFLSLPVMMDFFQSNWRTAIRISAPPPVGSPEMLKALNQLVIYQQTKRAEAMSEILAQNTDFQPFFCAQLGIYPRIYPKTYLMLKLAARIGEFVMVWLKEKYSYVRPSHIYPRLAPPMAVAAHASYPSGHSTVGHLMAFTLNQIIPQLGDAPNRLADRIAYNREYAGFHYPFDTQGGIEAAAKTFSVYQTLDFYLRTIDAARKEWDPYR